MRTGYGEGTVPSLRGVGAEIAGLDARREVVAERGVDGGKLPNGRLDAVRDHGARALRLRYLCNSNQAGWCFRT